MLEQEQGKAEEVSEMKVRAFEPVEESNEKYEGMPKSLVPWLMKEVKQPHGKQQLK